MPSILRHEGRFCGWILPALLALIPPFVQTPSPAQNARSLSSTQPAAALAQAADELAGGDWVLQYRAIRRLAELGTPEARRQLEGLLAGKEHPWVRGRALVALAELAGGEVLDRALTCAGDARPELRAAALEALAATGSPKGVPAAAAALKDPSLDVRCQAVLAVARLRKAEAWGLLKPLLASSDTRLLRHLARAMPEVGTEEAIAELTALADHEAAEVRAEAAGALGRLARPQDAPLLLGRMAKDRDPLVRRRAAEALAAYPPAVLREAMLAALKTGDNDHHSAAMHVLARRPDAETADRLAKLLAAGERQYGSALGAMVAYLGRVDAERHYDVLARHLSHEWENVRQAAIRAMAKSSRPERFAALKPLLADKSLTLCGEVVDSLRDANSPAPPEGWVRYLSAALRGQPDTQRRALVLIGERVGPAELAEHFAEVEAPLGGGHEYIRGLAAKLLGRIADEATCRRIAAAQGYVTDWKVVGPFPSDAENRGFGVIYPPEVEPDLDANYPEFRFGGGAVFEVVGDPPALRIGPPTDAAGGRTVVTYYVIVPQGQAAKLEMTVSAPRSGGNGQAAPAAKLSALLDGNALLAAMPLDAGDANSLQLPIPPSPSSLRCIELAVEPPAKGKPTPLRIARPRVVLADGKEIDLAAMASSAAVRTEPVGRQGERLRWETRQVTSPAGALALHDILPAPTNYQVAYAAAELVAPAEKAVVFEIDADDACAIWLNGKEVFRSPEAKADKVPVTLRAGPNRVLVKTANLVEWWFVKLRVTPKP